MKKTNSVLQILACIVLMGIVCSCGNSRNSKVDEQSMTDSVDEIAKDSTDKAEEAYNRTHSSDAIFLKDIAGNDMLSVIVLFVLTRMVLTFIPALTNSSAELLLTPKIR